MDKQPVIQKARALSVTILLTLVMLLSTVGSAVARDERTVAGRNAPAASPQRGLTDPAELEVFLDDLLVRQMEDYHIAGAAVSVVKDGELYFAKGYGHADLENGIPVDAEGTVFRIGSVGKVFTWTAVMQLVEQGRLDLDADIQTYLDFRIPDTYAAPITLKHLMTHTSGFDDRWPESLASDAGELIPAREWLVSNMPGPVRPPGEAAGYSNYNAMLAGYIVERVSGQPYEQYIQEHIFDPLGMTRSTVSSPTRADLRGSLSAGYTYADGAFQRFPDYVIQPAVLPSGAHQASVTDMARFMIAHLEHGLYRDESISEARILRESTARQMQSTLYTPDPRLRGTAYGLFDVSDNGQWTLGHEGYSPPMNSQLLLLPDENLGVYVVYNSLGARDGGLTTQHTGFQRAFFDHYFPAPAPAPLEPAADFAERAGRFVGQYGPANGHITTPEKVMGLFGALEIRDPGDGTLLIPMEGLELRFVEVEPLYFRQVDGPFALVFREDEQGRITHLFTDIQPQNAFVRLSWYQAPGFHMALALGCVLLFLSTIPVAALRFLRGRRPQDDRPSPSRGARAAARVIVEVSLLYLLFLAGIAIWFRPMHPSELHGIPSIVEIVMGLAVLAAALTVGALAGAVLAWKNGYWGIAFRTYYTLVTLAAAAFAWFLHYWNWLGWRY